MSFIILHNFLHQKHDMKHETISHEKCKKFNMQGMVVSILN